MSVGIAVGQCLKEGRGKNKPQRQQQQQKRKKNTEAAAAEEKPRVWASGDLRAACTSSL